MLLDASAPPEVGKSQSVKLAEWGQLKRVVGKGVPVRSPAGAADIPSKPVATSSGDVAAAPGSVAKAA